MNRRFKVLLIEDDQDDFFLTQDLLSQIEGMSFELEWVATYEAGLAAINRCEHDVYLLDYCLGEHSGLELLQATAASDCEAPIIVMTGQGDHDLDLEVMKAGAADYLEKAHLGSALLEHSIRYAVERKQAEASLRQQANRERLLTEIAQHIRQTLNLEDILNTTVSEVRQLLQAERVFIYRFELDWSGVIAVESVGPEWSSLLGITIKDTFFATDSGRDLYRQGRIQATADIYNADLAQCHIDLLAQFQIRANLVIPILQVDNLWGLLVVNHCSAPRPWQQWEIDFLKQLATQVAIALQQSELYRQAQTELAERQRTEATLRESEERYRSVVAAMHEGILVQDAQGRIQAGNTSAEKILGLGAEQLKQQTLGDLNWQAIHEDGSAFAEETYPAITTLKTGTPCSNVVMGIHKPDGSLCWISVNAQPLFRESETSPYAVVTSFSDITQKKQLEAQFLRAQRMESIGTLASGIAHDLNNVLAPVMMAAELLQKKYPDPKSQELLSILEMNAKRGADLIKQVLSFARGLEGKRTVLQVRHLILEIKKIVEQTFPKSIKVRTNIAPDLWTNAGDPTHLHQILMNLCVNARDAMPEGGTLSLLAENCSVDQSYAQLHLDAQVGAYVAITVTDTGVGISPEILDRIFEPFFTTKAPTKGTGLGLSTVIGIVKSHGGFITVESALNQGSQFKVYLPALKATESQDVEDTHLLQGQGELILVVDDEAAVQEMTKTLLETHGYSVTTASDGVGAIAEYLDQREAIDLVLIDRMMPSMDGPMTIRLLQDINPEIKIIAVSGLAASNKAAEAASMGVEIFLAKPYTAQELLSVLHQALHPQPEQG